MSKILFVTGNKHKVHELQELSKNIQMEIEQIDYDYPEIQASDLEDVALEGAKHCAALLDKSIIVEDAGIFISALNGFPGPYSRYVFDKIGNEGILKLMQGAANREAVFKSVVGYCKPGDDPISFTGTVKGELIREVRGEHGFGYDPIFVPDGESKTFAEMSTEEKNQYSHRKNAFEKFVEWVGEEGH